MTYTENNGRVVLEMTRDDYDQLLVILGYASAASMSHGVSVVFYRVLRFINELNRTNPNFTQYAIPPEYADAS
jgi:hypothetical protein